MLLADNLNQLLEIVPDFIQGPLKYHPKREILIEIVLVCPTQFYVIYCK